MMRLRIGVVALFLLFVPSLKAQTMVSKPIPFSYELSSNEIWNFSQDQSGYIWVATTSGVARYDGHRLVTVRNDYRNPSILADNDVTIVRDGGKYLWIGTRKGITLMEKSRYSLFSPQNEELQTVNASEIVVQGDNIWINGTYNHIFKCDKDGKLLKKFIVREDLNDNNTSISINNLYVDREGKLWACLGVSGVAYYDATKDRFVKTPITESLDAFLIYQDNRGHYWISGWEEGLYEFDAQMSMVRHHRIVNKGTGKEDLPFFSIVQDDAFGYLWLLSFNSLYAFNTEGGQFTSVDLSDIIKTHKMYTRIFKDRDGNLWLSSYDNSFIISFDKARVRNYTLPQITNLRGWDANLLDLGIDDDGMMWLAQDRFGLCLYDIQHDKLELKEGVRQAGNIKLKKSRSHNAFWLSSALSSEIHRYYREGWEVKPTVSYDLLKQDPQSGEITQMQEDADGNLWIQTSRQKLFVCAEEKIHKLKDTDGPVDYLMSDKEGRIWGITADGAICQFVLKAGIERTVLSHHTSLKGNANTRTAQIDDDGRIWLITNMGAVYQTDPRKAILTEVDIDHLLDDCTPLQILTDKDYMWIVSNKKIVKYYYQSKGYEIFSTNDENIEISQFKNRSAILDGHGGLYAGGHNGFIHIVKETDENRKHWKYEPEVSDITIGNQRQILLDDRNTRDKVVLTPGARNIEIFFSSYSYGIGQGPRIAYMLEGFDKDWVSLNPEKYSAFYNKLDDGTYRMRLKYEYEPGRWSESKVVLTIIQEPAWYETWWAYTLYSLIILGLAYLLLTTPFEMSKLRRRVEELMKKTHHHQIIMSKVSDVAPMNDGDEQLLKCLIAEIEANLTESEYDLTTLATSLGMSKSTLNRKVKALTDMTPSDFINSIRMKRACQLLLNSQLSVSEIAYTVGFTNPKYFTKCFKKELDCTPSEYKQQHKGD